MSRAKKKQSKPRDRRDAKPPQTIGDYQREPARADNPWWEMDAEQLLKHAWEIVSRLERMAYAGDSEAAIALVNLSGSCMDTPERLLPESPALQAKLRASAYWPVCLPAKKAKRERLVKQLRTRGFAEDCELNEKGKAGSAVTNAVRNVWELIRNLRTMKKTPPTVIVGPGRQPFRHEQWLEWAKANAQNIPQRPTKKNAPDLAKLTLPLLEIFWGADFETHPEFAEYARNAKCKGAGATALKDELRKLWRQSWRSIARAE